MDKAFIIDKKIIILKNIWILKRNKKEFDLTQAKEIKILRKWILENFFDFWDLIIEFKDWETLKIIKVNDILNLSKNLTQIINN